MTGEYLLTLVPTLCSLVPTLCVGMQTHLKTRGSLSFPRSAWECRPDAKIRGFVFARYGFPRRAWEPGLGLSRPLTTHHSPLTIPP